MDTINIMQSIGMKEVIRAREESIKNCSLTSHTKEVGQFMDGKLTCTVEFDNRVKEDLNRRTGRTTKIFRAMLQGESRNNFFLAPSQPMARSLMEQFFIYSNEYFKNTSTVCACCNQVVSPTSKVTIKKMCMAVAIEDRLFSFDSVDNFNPEKYRASYYDVFRDHTCYDY